MPHTIVCIALLLSAPAETNADAKANIDAEQASAVREIERAARDFRIQVYESFRLERDQYDAFRTAGDELLEGWTKAGRPIAYREDVLRWFREATELSLAGGSASLPGLPELPNPLPEAVVADDPSVAPHLPGMDRKGVEIRATGDKSPLEEPDFLGQPTPVDAQSGYDGPRFTPPSKILRSIQRALLSSLSECDADTDAEAESDSPVIEYPPSAEDPRTPFDVAR
jgi:hypothetical protein